MGDKEARQNKEEARRRVSMRGVRVLELSDSIAGAYCTRVLAATGADVVAVEPERAELERLFLEVTKGRRE